MGLTLRRALLLVYCSAVNVWKSWVLFTGFPGKLFWVKDSDNLKHEKLSLIDRVTFPKRLHFPPPFSYINFEFLYNTKNYSILNHSYCLVSSVTFLAVGSMRTGTTASSFRDNRNNALDKTSNHNHKHVCTTCSAPGTALSTLQAT